MSPRPVSPTTVSTYLRRRQRATLGGLAAMLPVSVLLAVLGVAAVALQTATFGVIALAWPVVVLGRLAARLIEDHGRLRRARALLDQPGVTCEVRGHLLWITAGDEHASVALEHSRALRPPRRELPPARALSRHP